MDAALLDTDVFSFFFKQDLRAGWYAADIANRQLCVSFQTVAELKRWAIERNWGTPQRERLAQVLKHYIVLPYDIETVEQWALIAAHAKRAGAPIACGDGWIAASAL